MSRYEMVSEGYLEAFNRHDVDAAAAFYADDCVVEDPYYPEPLRGRAAVRKDMVTFIRAFPDIRLDSIQRFEKGDLASEEVRMTGNNTGPLDSPMGEIPPTGKRFDAKGVVVVRLNDQGLIAEERRYYDTNTLLRQLELIPEPAAAGTAR